MYLNRDKIKCEYKDVKKINNIINCLEHKCNPNRKDWFPGFDKECYNTCRYYDICSSIHNDDTLTYEKKDLNLLIANLIFSYINKNFDTPHQFEINTITEACNYLLDIEFENFTFQKDFFKTVKTNLHKLEN